MEICLKKISKWKYGCKYFKKNVFENKKTSAFQILSKYFLIYYVLSFLVWF